MKSFFKLVDLRSNSEINLSQSKLLLGRGSNCDISVDDELVGYYHCLLTIHNDSIEIMDLESISGTQINNTPINKGTLLIGDQLQVGNSVFTCVEVFDEINEVNKLDNIQLQKETIQSTVPQVDYNEQHVLIDDEYCDIIFDQNECSPISKNPLDEFELSEFKELEQTDEIYNVVKETESRSFWITTLVNGNILSINNYPLEKTIMASPREEESSIYIPYLEKEVEFLAFSNGKISHATIDQFDLTIDLEDRKVLSFGSFQIMIEIKQSPSKIHQLPLFARNIEFIKDASKVFGGVFLPLLLLLLVDITIEKPEPLKHIATVYKKVIKSESKLNTGHKQKTKNEKKVASAKKGAKKPAKQKNVKKVVKVATAKKKTIKAYKLNLKSNVKNMFSKVSKIQIDNSRSIASNDIQVTKISNSGLSSSTVAAKVGNMGSDAAGTGKNSFGAKGLSSKSGTDSAYEQTKTVVLGSIDPELLRKILREYIPQFRHCYQQELVTNDDLQGIIDLNFRITASGNVSNIDISVKSVQFSSKGSGCMSKVLSIIDFPKPKGGGVVDVKQPLNFFSNRSKV